MTETTSLLDQYSETMSQADLARSTYEVHRAEILKVVQAELDALDAEYAPLLSSATTRLAELEAAIKAAVIDAGVKAVGKYHQAIYAHGRVSWDTKALDGYAAGHPEILPFRKEGAPSVSIRSVGK